MKKLLLSIIVSMLVSAGLFAADLVIDMQFNLSGKDYKNNYLTFKGKNGNVEKDQFDPAKVVDSVTGASIKKSTETFNAYRNDSKGKTTMPGSLRSLLMYAVASDATRVEDNLQVKKNADGTILVRYIHRGSAYEVTTDKNGVITFPTTSVKTRKIGDTDNSISTDFSKTGKTADVDWTKVWDANIADGKDIGKSKTGKIGVETATSELVFLEGTYKISIKGTIMKIAAELNFKNK